MKRLLLILLLLAVAASLILPADDVQGQRPSAERRRFVRDSVFRAQFCRPALKNKVDSVRVVTLTRNECWYYFGNDQVLWTDRDSIVSGDTTCFRSPRTP